MNYLAWIIKRIGESGNNYLIGAMIFLIGFSSGWLGYLLKGDIARQCQILYVSKQEILSLEKMRIENIENAEDNKAQMFLGHIDDALALMQKLAKKFKNNSDKVIFVGNSFIAGEDVHSISAQIHTQIINKLQEKYYENETK